MVRIFETSMKNFPHSRYKIHPPVCPSLSRSVRRIGSPRCKGPTEIVDLAERCSFAAAALYPSRWRRTTLYTYRAIIFFCCASGIYFLRFYQGAERLERHGMCDFWRWRNVDCFLGASCFKNKFRDARDDVVLINASIGVRVVDRVTVENRWNLWLY